MSAPRDRRRSARAATRLHATGRVTPARDLYQEVTDTIVAALERGVAPWVRGYNATDGRACAALDLPRNGLTGRRYSGVNVVLLWLATQERGYTSPEWYTFNQACEAAGLAKDAGGRWRPEEGKGVRKGERATLVTFWKELTVDDETTGESKRIPLLRHFCVFNRAQIGGLSPEAATVAEVRQAWERVEAAERVVAESGARVTEGSRAPCYDRLADGIGMPARTAYAAAEAFYVDLLHELTHWTGHPSRLAREFGSQFGAPEYAAEELVAELGAAFLCATLGVAGKLQHPEYIGSWIKQLKDDKRALFHAASQARQACAYLVTASPTLAAAGMSPSHDALAAAPADAGQGDADAH